eukprot:10933862-Ditylum_brightwellii.AAC.1
MKPSTKGITGEGVSKLWVPNLVALTRSAIYGKIIALLEFEHAQPFKVLDDKDEIMSTLVKQNKLHLHQAFDTSFAKPDMKNYISEYGTAEGTKDIPAGNLNPNKFDNLPAVNFLINTT